MRALFAVVLGGAALAASTPGLAQPNRPADAADGRRFAARPAPGEMLPEVTVFDAAGKEFPLRSLRGKHAVLVFGCLT